MTAQNDEYLSFVGTSISSIEYENEAAVSNPGSSLQSESAKWDCGPLCNLHPPPAARPFIHNANLSLSEQKTSSGKTLTRAARGKMHRGYKLCLVTQASLPLSSRHSKNFILIIISPFFISCNHTSALFVPPIPQMNSTKALSLR